MASRRQKLGAKWQLDAALLSRPVDLTALVSMSLSDPGEFFKDDTLHRMVKLLLNEGNERKSNHHTKLDVLGILANLAKEPSQSTKGEIKMVLQGVSEWFDDYLQSEPVGGVDEHGVPVESEMHKSMLLVLSRTYDYSLRTEDLLELAGGNRQTALVTAVALLEDGETYTTALTQRQTAGEGRVAQWERKLVCIRYERPMVLQLCRLLRGFTHPGSYFRATPPSVSSSSAYSASSSGSHSANFSSSSSSSPSKVAAGGGSNELTLFSVDQFSDEINSLLDLTLSKGLLEKLTVALHDCLFTNDDTDEYGDEDDDGGGDGGGRGFDDGDDHHDNREPIDEAPGERGAGMRRFGGPGGLVALGGGTLGMHRLMDQHEHFAVASVNGFLQNLYLYGTKGTAEYQQHLLADTTLIPRLVLPYLELCVVEARLLSDRQATEDRHASLGGGSGRGGASAGDGGGGGGGSGRLSDGEYALGEYPLNRPALSSSSSSTSTTSPSSPSSRLRDCGDGGGSLRRQSLALASGISASLRTLVIASFRVPPTRHMLHLLRQLNPTAYLLRASAFVAQHPGLFSLLCLLNVNMNALDLTRRVNRRSERHNRHSHCDEDEENGPEAALRHYDGQHGAYEDGEYGDDDKHGGGGGGSGGDYDDGGGCGGGDDGDFYGGGGEARIVQAYHAHSLLHDMALVHMEMSENNQMKVLQTVLSAGGLPVSRDTPSYAAVVSVLRGTSPHLLEEGGQAGAKATDGAKQNDGNDNTGDTGEGMVVDRRGAKSAASARLKRLSSGDNESPVAEAKHDSGGGSGGAGRVLDVLDGTLDAAVGGGGDGKGAALRAESKQQQQQQQHQQQRQQQQPDDGMKGGEVDLGPAMAKQSGGVKEENGSYRLLGNLPSLSGGRGGGSNTDFLRLQLELPARQQGSGQQLADRLGAAAARLCGNVGGKGRFGSSQRRKGGASVRSRRKERAEEEEEEEEEEGASNGGNDAAVSSEPEHFSSSPLSSSSSCAAAFGRPTVGRGVPQEFTCAINGHLMKEPVRSVHGQVFEQSTISLWLNSRGNVCPITHQPLAIDQLIPDADLRTKIIRWQIQQASSSEGARLPSGQIHHDKEEDVYDF